MRHCCVVLVTCVKTHLSSHHLNTASIHSTSTRTPLFEVLAFQPLLFKGEHLEQALPVRSDLLKLRERDNERRENGVGKVQNPRGSSVVFRQIE